MNIIHRARVLLINIGKVLPFVLCGIIFISYIETLFALATSDFVMWDGYIIPNKYISWIVGNYFEYDLVTLIALLVLSILVETCLWNKLSLIYLFIQLQEKDYFIETELEIEYVYVIVIVNILVSGFFVLKGINVLRK